MRKLWWVLACLAAGACVGGAFFAAWWLLQVRSLPLLDQMRAACSGAPAAPIPAFATAAKCREYFADLGVVYRPAVIGAAITGALAAYVFLVARFRVRRP